jgi:hypothetical protein
MTLSIPAAMAILRQRLGTPVKDVKLVAIEPERAVDDYVPLAERLKYYARRDAIEASTGKVVELKQPGELEDRPPT